jgi:hypothetical protein
MHLFQYYSFYFINIILITNNIYLIIKIIIDHYFYLLMLSLFIGIYFLVGLSTPNLYLMIDRYYLAIRTSFDFYFPLYYG